VKSLAVVVTTPPSINLTVTALSYIEAAVDAGYNVIGVFFYQDGVLNASKHLSIPSDEFQTVNQWHKLSKDNKIPLHLCITAAEKRGLSDDTTQGSTISDAYTISGLGELVELTAKADRVVQL